MSYEEAIKKWAFSKWSVPGAQSVTLDEERRSTGYCDTCYYEYNVVAVRFYDISGRLLSAIDYETSFTELLKEIISS